MPLDLPVTSLAVLLNAMLFLVLTIRVITYRRGRGVVYGDSNDKVLMKRIRGQGNAAEQMPIALILIAVAELQGAGFTALMGLALVFTLGRLLHGVFFAVHGMPWQLRFYGMLLTLIAQGGLIGLLLLTMFT